MATATADLGLVLKREFPFVHAVSVHCAAEVCAYCLKRPSNGALKRCTGCKMLHYCNRDCQTLDWADHKAECSHLTAETFLKFGSEENRLMLRVLMKLKRNVEPAFNGQTLESLSSRSNDILRNNFLKDLFWSTRTALVSQLGSNNFPSDSGLLDLFSKVILNCISIQNFKGQELAFGLYIGLSELRYSCDPDVSFNSEGSEMLVRPIKEGITEYNGKLSRAFRSVLAFGSARRKELLEGPMTTSCCCERCKDTEWESEGRSLRCTFCSHGYCPLDLDGDKVKSEPVCVVCGMISKSDVHAAVSLMNKLDDEREKLTPSLNEYARGKDSKTALNEAMKLYKMGKTSLSWLNISMCRFAMELTRVAIWDGSFSICSELEEEALICYRHFLRKGDPSIAMRCLSSGIAHVHARKMKRAKQRFKQCFTFCLPYYGLDGTATKEAQSHYLAAFGNDTKWMDELIRKRKESNGH